MDLGTQCTNTEIRREREREGERERERGSQADIAAMPTPPLSPPLHTHTIKNKTVLRDSTPTEKTPRHGT